MQPVDFCIRIHPNRMCMYIRNHVCSVGWLRRISYNIIIVGFFDCNIGGVKNIWFKLKPQLIILTFHYNYLASLSNDSFVPSIHVIVRIYFGSFHHVPSCSIFSCFNFPVIIFLEYNCDPIWIAFTVTSSVIVSIVVVIVIVFKRKYGESKSITDGVSKTIIHQFIT